jgi:hypothetical protein
LALKLVLVREIVVVVLGDNQYLLDLSVVYQGINDLATLCSWKFRHFNVDLLRVSMSTEEPLRSLLELQKLFYRMKKIFAILSSCEIGINQTRHLRILLISREF